jgi:acyl CoA:acetate/3-ketoacid CoA transferase alpha subunit
MATTLSISGLLGSTPAAHANETCAVVGVSFIECIGTNVRGHRVIITISHFTGNPLIIMQVLNNDQTFINGTPAQIVGAIKYRLNNAGIFTCRIDVNVEGEGTASGSC